MSGPKRRHARNRCRNLAGMFCRDLDAGRAVVGKDDPEGIAQGLYKYRYIANKGWYIWKVCPFRGKRAVCNLPLGQCHGFELAIETERWIDAIARSPMAPSILGDRRRHEDPVIASTELSLFDRIRSERVTLVWVWC